MLQSNFGIASENKLNFTPKTDTLILYHVYLKINVYRK